MKFSPVIRSVVSLLVIAGFFGCGLERKGDLNQSPSVAKELNIESQDWDVHSRSQGENQVTTRTLKAEKLDSIQRRFRAPRINPIMVPESNGFELFEVQGYSEFESALYLHPKLFINSGTAQGGILGYKVRNEEGLKDDLIEVSIPVALVNGLVSGIPLVGGAASSTGGVVKLPEKFQIPNLDSLQTRVGKSIRTLPVCPKFFRLIFENKEYWAQSPFQGQSYCPINQFFRIKFRAPAQEMKRILETAAIRDESVTLVTNLKTSLGIPKFIAELKVSPDSFRSKLLVTLQGDKELGKSGGGHSFPVQQIEDAVLEALLAQAQEFQLSLRLGTGVLGQIHPLIANYFSDPVRCESGNICRKLLEKPSQVDPVEVSWEESELLFTPLETQATAALGAVANASLFESKPSQSQLSLLRRPPSLKGRSFEEVIRTCLNQTQEGFILIPETTDSNKTFFKEYCQSIAENIQSEGALSEETEGYTPLGSNTLVYPGAWLRIDIEEISELTTARRKVLPNGRVITESKVIDLLSPEFGSKTPLTACVQGSQLACARYKTKRVEYRDYQGNKTQGPCEKGSPDCVCTVGKESGTEVCTRSWYEVLDYTCDPAYLRSYCPYWRTDEEVVDYEIEYDCQTETVEDSTSFLCLAGCKKRTELVCKEKSRKPIKAPRQKLNCIGDDPLGIANREQYCSRPQYQCEVWNEHCTQYHVNEAFQIVHEEISPQWRPFAIELGEYPKRFEEDIYLKFVSPYRKVTNCRLDRFAREFRGNSIFIKLPSEDNSGFQPCDQPLWEKGVNTHPLYYPKVFIKNTISYPQERLCGKTEYSFLSKAVPRRAGSELVPGDFTRDPEIKIGPVEGSCQAEHKFRKGNDYWFVEYAPIRFSGKVSVLGKILEGIVTETKQ